jgi:hypothetical protein
VDQFEFLDNMERIEREFSQLKDRLFGDQIHALKREYQTIKAGTHERFADKLEELSQQRAEKIANSRLWLDYQVQHCQTTERTNEQVQSEPHSVIYIDSRPCCIHR